MAKPSPASPVRSGLQMLTLGWVSAFLASLLVVHLLGPLVLTAFRGRLGPDTSVTFAALAGAILPGLALLIAGAALSWLVARALPLTRLTAGLGIGLVGTLTLWAPQVASRGYPSLWAQPGVFPLRLGLAIAAGLVAGHFAWRALPLAARHPYAALMDETKPRVVIVGGGFGGLAAAQALAKAPVRVTLIDAHNHHLFQPLLYQVATAALPASAIAGPLRRVLRDQGNAEVIMGRVDSVDLSARQVALEGAGAVAYDYLILAAGSTDSYFGHEEWAELAPGLKSLGQALEIRNRMLCAFEKAEQEKDPERRRALLTFAVVGGGPTGVELAGAFSEIARQTLGKDFRHIDPKSARVVLIEAGPRVLASFDPKLSEVAKKDLLKLSVEVLTLARVTAMDAHGLVYEQDQREHRLDAETLIWAAGVKASPLGKSLGVPLDKGGRVPAQADLTLEGHPEVFLVGDMISLSENGKAIPGLAPAAMQEGRHAAKNLLLRLNQKPSEPFRYFDKGSLATIGRGRAVGQVGKLKFAGFLAFVAWVFVHILYLIGFRNRYLVLTEWAFSYVTNDRGARVIATAGDDDDVPGAPGESLGPAPAPSSA